MTAIGYRALSRRVAELSRLIAPRPLFLALHELRKLSQNCFRRHRLQPQAQFLREHDRIGRRICIEVVVKKHTLSSLPALPWQS